MAKVVKKKKRKAPNPTGKNGDRTNAILASQGNEWWKIRSKHGRDAIFTDPNVMMESFEEYETFCRMNPEYQMEYKGTPLRPVMVPLKVCLFLQGFCDFIRTHPGFWSEFKKSKTYEKNKDFSEVMKNIENRCYKDQFIGGTNGQLNSMLIARSLNLREGMNIDVGAERKSAADLFPDDSEFKSQKKKDK